MAAIYIDDAAVELAEVASEFLSVLRGQGGIIGGDRLNEIEKALETQINAVYAMNARIKRAGNRPRAVVEGPEIVMELSAAGPAIRMQPFDANMLAVDIGSSLRQLDGGGD